jgi:hypothetical protein
VNYLCNTFLADQRETQRQDDELRGSTRHCLQEEWPVSPGERESYCSRAVNWTKHAPAWRTLLDLCRMDYRSLSARPSLPPPGTNRKIAGALPKIEAGAA